MRAPLDGANNLTDWSEQPKERRDWKKLFLITGLALLSWVATYVGMLELIEANMGELPIVHKIIIGFSVGMLMTMVVWLLDQLFAPVGLMTKLFYGAGYLFLTVISVGFGFGFYWKVLESKGEGTRGAETAITQVSAPLLTAANRLESLSKTLDSLQTTSAQKAEIERTQGTSCPNSKPGDGPRRKLRDDDAARFAFARDVFKTRIEGVKGDIAAIDGELQKLIKNDASIVDKSGTRNDFIKQVGRRLDTTVTNFNAFKGDPQLKQIRNDLDERAGKTQFIDTQGKPYACPDQALATMIRSVVASIDGLPTLDKPKITTVEGSDATIEAFRRLTATFYGALSFKLPPSVDELRELQKKAVATAEGGRTVAQLSAEGAGLSKRDYIPLAIAIFVDICLLLVSMGRPMNRLGNLVPKMQAAEQGPVIQILSRFNEIHRDRQIRENFEIFRHVVFDMNGDYYVAVPLDAPPKMNPRDREDLRLEAQLLANLFTSFEKEKIFSRVLMPYISTKQIQKKLWKQGSKFSHSESFRLYKFKDGAWSEIILGAIMGAAKRVEGEKRRRRIEDEVFTRHEPRFTGPSSQSARAAATGHPMPQPHGALSGRPQANPAQDYGTYGHSGGHGGSHAGGHAGHANQAGYAPVPPPPQVPPRAATAYAPQPHAPRQAVSHQAYGPYAAAVEAAYMSPSHHPEHDSNEEAYGTSNVAPHPATIHAAHAPRRSEPHVARAPQPADVADLADYRHKVEAQTDLSVRVANNNTAPAERAKAGETPQDTTAVIEAAGRIVPQAGAKVPDVVTAVAELATEHVTQSVTGPTVKIEAVERKITWHVPARDTTMPASIEAIVRQATPALAAEAAETVRIAEVPSDTIVEVDPAAGTAVALLPEANDDTLPTFARRFAPAARQP